MRGFYKMAAMLAALMVSAVMFTGCEEAEQQGSTILEEDLPYGATMRESKTGFALPVSYDRRFINDEMVTVLTNYLSAIQNCDGELYAANTLDFYADYQLNEVYSEQYSTMDEMMTALHSSVAEATADDFTYAMVTVENFTAEQSATGLGTMVEVLTDLSGDENFEESLDGCWTVEMQWLLEYDGGASSVLISEQMVYLFELDGQYYCVM